jgi:hypothetical protein
MMHYTPRQLRDAVGITAETYRHWRKALPPLSKACGHGAIFTPGDLVATTVVRMMCSDLDVRVRALSAVANGLFEICRATPWPTLERGYLHLEIQGSVVEFSIDEYQSAANGIVITVPMRPIINHLQGHLMDTGVDISQHTLRFPPTAIQGINKKAAKRGSVLERKI